MSDSCAGLDVHSPERSQMRLSPLLPAVAAAAMLAAPACASAAEVVPGKVILRYKSAPTRSERATVQRRPGTRFGMRRRGGPPPLRTHGGESVKKTTPKLNRHDKVAYAVPDYQVHA